MNNGQVNSHLSSAEKRPLVSVIVPVYNAGEFLRPCLDSLVNQTLQEIEIICVLDCPTDGSDKVVEEYASKDARFKVIRNDHNLNIGETRNVGIRSAKGEFVGFSDHDDLHKKDMYERLYNAVKEGRYKFAVADQLGIYTSQFPTNEQLAEAFLSVLGRKVCTHVTPCIYDRQFLINNRIFFVDNNKCSPEDSLFNSKVLAKLLEEQTTIAALPHDLYNHINHSKCQNKSYGYWALEKIILAIHEADSIAAQTHIDERKKSDCLFSFCVKSLYTSFLREREKKGLVPTLKQFNHLKEDPIVSSIIQKAPVSALPDLTIPKRLFANYIKLICKR